MVATPSFLTMSTVPALLFSLPSSNLITSSGSLPGMSESTPSIVSSPILMKQRFPSNFPPVFCTNWSLTSMNLLPLRVPRSLIPSTVPWNKVLSGVTPSNFLFVGKRVLVNGAICVVRCNSTAISFGINPTSVILRSPPLRPVTT